MGADRLLGLDELPLEQGDELVPPAAMQRVLAQFDDGDFGCHGRKAPGERKARGRGRSEKEAPIKAHD